MSGGFQTHVYVQPAAAVEGDFATSNPRFTTLAGPGGLVTGDEGVFVARFGWTRADPVDPNGSPQIVDNTGTGAPAGFVGREQQGLDTEFLSHASMHIPRGFGLTLYSGGDFWVRNSGEAAAAYGDACYADLATGEVTFGAGGVKTIWRAASAGAQGELVKITSWPPGS